MTSHSRSVRGFVAAVLCFGLAAFSAACQKRSEAPATTTSVTTSLDSTSMAAIDPGQQAYLTHCAMCHGQWGGGDGPLAAQLWEQAKVRPAVLDSSRMAGLSRDEVIRVITEGGGHTGRSNLMPPWAGKLDKQLIAKTADFVKMLPDLKSETPPAVVQSFLAAPPGSPPEGRRLFVFYCVACHGPEGRGDGQLADSLWARNRIRPRNLTDSTYFASVSDQQIFATVSLGGAHFHKSPYMPMWSLTLQPGQIKSLVSYIRAISRTGAAATVAR